MADFVDITSLTLGTTFGGWYAKNNDMITRLNALNVASITGGDGIIVSPHTAANGGYTLTIAGTVNRDMIFNNVTVTGNLVSNFAGAVSGTTIILPANTGVTVGNIVYIDSAGNLQKALADDECTAEVVGIVIGFTGGSAQVATTGRISGSSIIEAFTGTVGATLQKGVVYFLSGGVSGAGTTLEPDVTSYVSKPMLLGLTGDSGLILPYRGFIATEGTVGNTTVVQGVCGGSGVLSVNGLTASIFLSGTPNIRKTTGHIHAVNAINLGDNSGVVAKTVTLNSARYTSRRNPGIATYLPEQYDYLINNTGTSLEKINVNKHTPTPSNKIYLSTLGTIDDVYRLHRIRITSTNLISVRVNFVINKAYNNLGSSNFKEEFGALGGNFTQSYIEYRMKNCVILGEDTSISYNPTHTNSFYLGLASPSVSAGGIHLRTGSGDIITPILRTPYGGSSSTGITASTATGVLDSAGVYPVMYSTSDYTNPFSYADQYNRVYAWQFNSVVLTGKPVSGYINTAATSVDFDPNDNNGYTLDSSVLGWNTTTGAIPETVAISFPSLDNYYNSTLQPESIDLHTILEVYKYNPTSGVTGPIIMIPKDFTYSTNFTQNFGSPAVNVGAN